MNNNNNNKFIQINHYSTMMSRLHNGFISHHLTFVQIYKNKPTTNFIIKLLSSILVPLGSFKICSDAKERMGCGKQREATITYLSLVKLQPWFLSLPLGRTAALVPELQ